MVSQALYTIDESVARQVPSDGEPLVLLYAFDGFLDAGIVGGLIISDLLAAGKAKRLVTFHTDELVDYRERRPPMIFENTGWSTFLEPRLGIDLVLDADGRHFLLLHGTEPDFRWEGFAAAVIEILERFGVNMCVGMYGMPMPVPHTRPLGVSMSATTPDLAVAPTFGAAGVYHMPGSAGAHLQLRIGDHGIKGATYAAHVPNYLATTPFPASAAELMRRISETCSLSLDSSRLERATGRWMAQIAAQVEDSQNLRDVVRALEDSYDLAQTSGRAPVPRLPVGAAVPTAEEISAEVEAFLANYADWVSDDDGIDGTDSRAASGDGGGHNAGQD